jgi:hypothetical protein
VKRFAATVRQAFGTPPEEVAIGPGDLTAGVLTTQRQVVLVIGFDFQAHHGSISVQEADQLVRAFGTARLNRWPVVLLMETSGIRVTDGTAGVASLRRVLREAEDARLEGIRMLAVVLRCAFGGASILASLCERQLIRRRSLYGMSGPKLIAQSVGTAAFDANDAAAVSNLLGGRARFGTSTGFRLIEADLESLGHAVRDWLRSPSPPPTTLQTLRGVGAELGQRLGDYEAEACDRSSTTPDEGMLEALRLVFPEGYELMPRGGVMLGRSDARPDTRALLMSAPEGAGAGEVLAMAMALLEPAPADGECPGTTVVLVDSPGHRVTPEDERVVLSEFLAHLALSVRALHRITKRVELVVVKAAGGGIQGALGSGATSVSMCPGGRLVVLPPAALRALGKAQGDNEGLLCEALATGAVDFRFGPEG